MKSKLIFLGIFSLTALILPTSIAADESYSEDGFLVLGQDDLVGISFWIATAAMLHLATSVSIIDSETYPGDLLGPLYHEGDLIDTALELGPKIAKVPEGPGLGVTLDNDQIERWKEV